MRNAIKRVYLFLTLKIWFPLLYRIYSRKPVEKNKVIFIEANLPELSGSLKYLYQQMEKRGSYVLKIHCLKELYLSRLAFLKKEAECLRDAATAGTIFLCEGSRLVSCLTPRKETTIVQVWHGCGAFKKFGFSTSELRFGGSREEYLKYSYYGNYNLVTVSSAEVMWAYEEAMNIDRRSGIVQPLGISRTDIFFREEYRDRAWEHVKRILPQIRGRKIILYAPTFRGSVGKARTPDELDIPALEKALGKEYFLLVKHHPVVAKRPPIPEEVSDFAADVTETFDIEELLMISDICISDYSSLIFEYSLFERPMIFFAFDLEEYGDWRGFYYDYDELTPGPVVRTTGEIIEFIQKLDTEFDIEKVRAFKRKYMSACDGHATDRLIKFITEETD